MQLIHFARIYSNVSDFKNIRNIFLTGMLLKQGYHKRCAKSYQRHSELIIKYNADLKTFCNKAFQSKYFINGDFVYELKIIVGKPSLHDQFKKVYQVL